MTSPRFIRGLNAYLDHWLRETADLDDTTIRKLNPDFPGLLKVVELGLVLPETQVKTADLILQCFFWVEQVGYVSVWQPLVESVVQKISSTNTRLHFRLLKQLGQFQRLQYQLDTAVATLQQAEELAYSLADEQAVAEIYLNLCQVYHLQGKYEAAERYGRLALERLSDEQPTLKASTLRTIGILAREQGHLKQAEALIQASLQIPTIAKEKALTLNVLAAIFQQQEQYSQALTTYDELLTLVDSIVNKRLFIEIQLNKGSILYSTGQLDEAEIICVKTEKLLQEVPGLFFYKALTANHLGCILREKQRFEAAESSFRRSIQQFKQIDSDIYQAYAWGNLAKLYVRQARRAEGIICYDEALKLIVSYPNNILVQELQTNFITLRNELL